LWTTLAAADVIDEIPGHLGRGETEPVSHAGDLSGDVFGAESGDETGGLVECADPRLGVGELGRVVLEDVIDELVGEWTGALERPAHGSRVGGGEGRRVVSVGHPRRENLLE